MFKYTFALIFLLSCMLISSLALAFEPSKTCGSYGFPCEDGEEAKELYWPSGCVSMHLNEEGTAEIDFDRVLAATQSSFDSWTEVECSYFTFVYAGLTNEDRVGYVSGAKGNANILVFRDDEWTQGTGVLALSSVTFDRTTGKIVDADIEFNTADFRYTSNVSAATSAIDYENTLTHELGHVLGLDHTEDEEATMYPSAPNHEVKKRTLEQDDIDGICHTYSNEEGTQASCNADEQGYYDRSLTDQVADKDDDCSCSQVRRSSSLPGLGMGLLLLGFLALGRRKYSAK